MRELKCRGPKAEGKAWCVEQQEDQCVWRGVRPTDSVSELDYDKGFPLSSEKKLYVNSWNIVLFEVFQ